uniref:Uncharacterized protein n=1 Tax=Anguilla anguilla TaxID=7936 RepID=A0A0E9PWJ7_ANGAN
MPYYKAMGHDNFMNFYELPLSCEVSF